jgi:glucose/arabinose dehydrogenase
MENSAPTRDAGGPALALATAPPSFSDVAVATGLVNPTQMEIAPDGRIFVSEQPGRVRVIKDGTLLAAPFVALNANSDGERGALGIAFDPAFASNHYVYVYYTSASGPHNRVSRFTADGDTAAGGETVILDLPTLSSATNHNGGAIHFGADGKLYIGVGENATPDNSQSLSTPLGKLLRINADGSIPSDNPFYGSTTGINRAIWALGLRNPYTFAVQPGTGRILIDDVGQGAWEEIDDGIMGANYGWPTVEGPTSDPRFRTPLYPYDHGSGCAISGGTFYNPAHPAFPSDYVGAYFFTDYCSGWIRRLDLGSMTASDFAAGIGSPTDLKVGDDGALYYVERGTGSVRKIVYAGAGQAPAVTGQPADQTVSAGAAATFTVSASGTAPLAYQWQRNQADIAGATAASYTLANAQAADSGARFRCRVTNAYGSALSNEATLTVTAAQPPTARITAPAAGSDYIAGQTLAFAGTGTDPRDGDLPASAFTWEIRLWHDDGNLHSHPAFGPVSGMASGSFAIPDQGETSPNVWYRVYLTVANAQGLTGKDSVDVLPVKATVTLASDPSGLQLKLDGIPVTAPYAFVGVAGMKRTIEAVTPQTASGTNWTFASWSDGGAASHVIVTPASAATFTAAFAQVPADTQATYEAEQARLYGAVAAARYPGYTGAGYADYIHNYNDYVEWTANRVSAGTATLSFRYALFGRARALRITVNGIVAASKFSFPNTGSWSAWRTVSLSVPLNAGANAIRATAIGASGPNMDNLTVR